MIENFDYKFSELDDKTATKLWFRFKELGIKLDLTRGKPSASQLDLSLGLLEAINTKDYLALDGTDCRNYGGIDGISEAKQLMSDMLGVEVDQIIVAGNSSLQLMHDVLTALFLDHRTYCNEVEIPRWKDQKIKFICQVPGYDRHFELLKRFDIEMISVPLLKDGPDLATIKKLVANDGSIKGIWCVPKYSNPTGHCYTEDCCRELAKMKTKADDFKIFWDNAYQVHHLTEHKIEIPDIIKLCQESGHPERVFVFGSTSKITFAGAGIAAVASSTNNINWLKRGIGLQTVGPDKINQLRHVKFFKNNVSISKLMTLHAEILAPKFKAVNDILNHHFNNTSICSFTEPKGGYFTTLTLHQASAKRVVELAALIGIKLTPAGSTHPYGIDPEDSTIRIAPSFPPLSEVKTAIQGLALCVAIASKNFSIP